MVIAAGLSDLLKPSVPQWAGVAISVGAAVVCALLALTVVRIGRAIGGVVGFGAGAVGGREPASLGRRLHQCGDLGDVESQAGCLEEVRRDGDQQRPCLDGSGPPLAAVGDPAGRRRRIDADPGCAAGEGLPARRHPGAAGALVDRVRDPDREGQAAGSQPRGRRLDRPRRLGDRAACRDRARAAVRWKTQRPAAGVQPAVRRPVRTTAAVRRRRVTASPPTGSSPAYGQQPYGQPAYEPPSYGQPSYEQPSYGQPAYGQPQGYGHGGYNAPTEEQAAQDQAPEDPPANDGATQIIESPFRQQPPR